ncbi:MAG: CRISPR-associated endonuclease Cas2 [Candidatus Paceibacterota bacterium]
MKKGGKAAEVLKVLAGITAGALLIPIALSPGGAQLLKKIIDLYKNGGKIERYRIVQDLNKLQKRKLISLKKLENGDLKAVITKKGKKEVLSFNAEKIVLKKEIPEDKKWRMVMFDVPVSKNRQRRTLSARLKKMGFYKLQKSVFITPYECEKEIDFISSVLEVGEDILIFKVDSFDGEKTVRDFFEI